MRFLICLGKGTSYGSWLAACVGLAIMAAVVCFGCNRAPQAETPQDAPWLDPAAQVELLKTGDYRLQVLAAKNLGNLGAQAADSVPELEKLRDDPNPKVRHAVRAAIGEIMQATGGDTS